MMLKISICTILLFFQVKLSVFGAQPPYRPSCQPVFAGMQLSPGFIQNSLTPRALTYYANQMLSRVPLESMSPELQLGSNCTPEDVQLFPEVLGYVFDNLQIGRKLQVVSRDGEDLIKEYFEWIKKKVSSCKIGSEKLAADLLSYIFAKSKSFLGESLQLETEELADLIKNPEVQKSVLGFIQNPGAISGLSLMDNLITQSQVLKGDEDFCDPTRIVSGIPRRIFTKVKVSANMFWCSFKQYLELTDTSRPPPLSRISVPHDFANILGVRMLKHPEISFNSRKISCADQGCSFTFEISPMLVPLAIQKRDAAGEESQTPVNVWLSSTTSPGNIAIEVQVDKKGTVSFFLISEGLKLSCESENPSIASICEYIQSVQYTDVLVNQLVLEPISKMLGQMTKPWMNIQLDINPIQATPRAELIHASYLEARKQKKIYDALSDLWLSASSASKDVREEWGESRNPLKKVVSAVGVRPKEEKVLDVVGKLLEQGESADGPDKLKVRIGRRTILKSITGQDSDVGFKFLELAEVLGEDNIEKVKQFALDHKKSFLGRHKAAYSPLTTELSKINPSTTLISETDLQQLHALGIDQEPDDLPEMRVLFKQVQDHQRASAPARPEYLYRTPGLDVRSGTSTRDPEVTAQMSIRALTEISSHGVRLLCSSSDFPTPTLPPCLPIVQPGKAQIFFNLAQLNKVAEEIIRSPLLKDYMGSRMLADRASAGNLISCGAAACGVENQCCFKLPAGINISFQVSQCAELVCLKLNHAPRGSLPGKVMSYVSRKIIGRYKKKSPGQIPLDVGSDGSISYSIPGTQALRSVGLNPGDSRGFVVFNLEAR